MAVTQISLSQAVELATNPGYYLRPDAANAWDRAVGDFGKQVLITGAWRSYATQEKLFDGEKFPNQAPQYGRYLRGNRAGQRGFTTDVRWWPAKNSYWTRKAGTAAAAVPGTSNHGGGVSVDVQTRRYDNDPPYSEAVIFAGWNDVDRTQFLRVAAKHGWYDTEGRSVNEPWHLTYYPHLDQHKGEKPKPLTKEDGFLRELNDTEQREILHDSRQSIEKLERIEELLNERVPDIGTESGLKWSTALYRILVVLRRVEARIIARQVVPVDVEVDTAELADALIKVLPTATAKAVQARLAESLKP